MDRITTDKVITNLTIDMPTFKVNPLTITPDLPTNSTIATKVTPLSNQSKLMPLMTVIPQTMNQTIVKMKGWDPIQKILTLNQKTNLPLSMQSTRTIGRV